MKIATSLAILLALASAGGATYLVLEHGRLATRVAELEAAQRALEDPASTARSVDRAVDSLVPELGNRVLERLEAEGRLPHAPRATTPDATTAPSAETLLQGIADLEQLALRVDTLETDGATLAPGSFEQLLASRLPGGETVEDFLDRRIAERRLGKGKGGHGNDGKGEWSKHSFDELATALALDELQQIDVRRVIDGGKDRAYEIFNTPRPDGGNFVDDLADALMGAGDENPDDVAGRVFIRALGEPFPGGEGTYGTRLFEAQGATASEISGLLRDDQRDTFKSLSFDLFDIGTGHDPFQEHVMGRITGQPGATGESDR